MNSVSHIEHSIASDSFEKVHAEHDFAAGSGGVPLSGLDDARSDPPTRSVPPNPLPSSLVLVSPESESLSTTSFSCRTSSISFAWKFREAAVAALSVNSHPR